MANKFDINELAAMLNVEITEEQAVKFTKKLNGYIKSSEDAIKAVNIENVKTANCPFDFFLSQDDLRDDSIEVTKPEGLLENTSHDVVDNLIKIKGVLRDE